MNARGLLAAAFAVLGVYYMAIAVAGLAMIVIARGWEPVWVTSSVTRLGLGVLFLLLRNRLAEALAPGPAGDEAVPTAVQLQTVGITLLGLWFSAVGAIAIAGDALATLLSIAAEQDPPSGRFVQRNAESIATTLAGVAIITIANRIAGWLDRIRRAR
jgi:hypothetical protein